MKRFVLLLAAGLGCTSGRPTPTAPETEPPQPRPVDIQAADTEWRARMQEHLKGKSVHQQEQMMVSHKLYLQALELYNAADYSRAIDTCREALKVWPGHLEARSLLSRLENILYDKKYGSISDVENQFRVRIQQTKMEIIDHLRKGERCFVAKEYAEAEKEFQMAEIKLKTLPDETIRAEFQQLYQYHLERLKSLK